jgi:hypothetical protein
VLEATPLSCVDLLESGLQEYMTAIKNAIDLLPVIRDEINRCNCNLHRSDCELGDDKVMNNEGISFNDLLKLSATKMIRASCCKAVEDLVFCTKVGSNEKPERLIPWKCTHQTCDQCGIDKMFQLHQCPVFVDCEIPKPVKEWLLAPWAGTNKQKTQIELTEMSAP